MELSKNIKPFVFVLMPFNSSFDDIYKLGIKQACIEAGAYCERVDEQIYDENMLDRIYNQIAKADIIVADLTGKNPNVFYETGYAHALGKNVILLTQKFKDIPFDLSHYSHIIYGDSISTLKEDLIQKITWYISNMKKGMLKEERHLDFYIKANKLIDEPEITCYFDTDDKTGKVTISISVEVHNPFNTMFNNSINLGIIVPNNFCRNISGHETILQPDGKYIHVLGQINNLYPKSWKTLNVKLEVTNYSINNKLSNSYGYKYAPIKELIKLNVYTEMGLFEYPFVINCRSFAK